MAAGVIGLIGSEFPTLSEAQIRAKLYNSCEKVGGYNYYNNPTYPFSSWNTEMGYGRVNAYLALQGGGSIMNPPTNLAADVAENNVQLTWTAPGGGGGTEDLIYDNGNVTGSYNWDGNTMSTHMSPSGPCKILELKYYTTGSGNFNAVISTGQVVNPEPV